jgi:hypothetical protein
MVGSGGTTSLFRSIIWNSGYHRNKDIGQMGSCDGDPHQYDEKDEYDVRPQLR